jgi:hypothetical protein
MQLIRTATDAIHLRIFIDPGTVFTFHFTRQSALCGGGGGGGGRGEGGGSQYKYYISYI